jgi:signal transduction histidine kinase
MDTSEIFDIGAQPSSAKGQHAARDTRALADSLVQLYQKERARLAFDLHDGPAQSIASALLQLRLLRGMRGAELADGLDYLEQLLVAALDDLYAALEQLRSRALDRGSLMEKIETPTAEPTPIETTSTMVSACLSVR